MVIDPQALFKEVDELARMGMHVDGRLLISEKAHVILPYHRELDVLSEARRGERKIGTTSRGIGPAYEDKIGRRGIRVCDLLGDRRRWRRKCARTSARATGSSRTPRSTGSRSSISWSRHGERMRPWVDDISLFLHRTMADGKTVMFEGAQATLLDIDHGTYPFVTSSNASVGGVCTGLGVPPRAIGGVLGVAKAYTTRVGEGPLPTELSGDAGRSAARERAGVRRVHRTPAPLRLVRRGRRPLLGAHQRARRHRADQARRARRPAGGAALHRLQDDERHGHRVSGGPAVCWRRAEPVYETLPGWSAPTKGVTRVRSAAGRGAALRPPARRDERRGVRDHLDRLRPRRDDRQERVARRAMARVVAIRNANAQAQCAIAS